MAAKGETQPIVTVQATNATLQTVPGTGPAPAAMSMAGLAEADGVRIEQVFDLMEVVSGCEAKNRYRVKPMVGGVPGPQTMFIKEESDCCERICCVSRLEELTQPAANCVVCARAQFQAH